MHISDTVRWKLDPNEREVIACYIIFNENYKEEEQQ